MKVFEVFLYNYIEKVNLENLKHFKWHGNS